MVERIPKIEKEPQEPNWDDAHEEAKLIGGEGTPAEWRKKLRKLILGIRE